MSGKSRVLSRRAKEFGFTVDVIHRGDEALEVILDNRFDAIVLGHYASRPRWP
jgi:DNA-binding response OmpR family regulator